MNKKILTGCIGAVTILVLVSFTGVVGYQTTKYSTITKTSPLFTIRSSRAIDEESKGLFCDYIGKGEESTIQFTASNSRNIRLQKAINIISRMDDKIFDRFVNEYLKLNQNDIDKQDIFNSKEEPLIWTWGFIWVPGCLLEEIFCILYDILYDILEALFPDIHTRFHILC